MINGGVEEDRRKPEGAVKREICLAKGHGQGLLVRITTKEVLTVCEKKRKICIVQCPFVNMPLLTLTIPCSHPETCCFLRPKFTLLESEGAGRE